MTVRLTETAISRALKEAADTATRIELSDAALPGLRLRVTPSGGRTWVLACRDPLSRMRRFQLGEHPTMGIAEARDAARDMRVDVRKGADPVAEARQRRAIGKDAKAGIGTLGAVLDIYEKHKGKTLKSWPHSRKRVDLVFKPLMARPVATMTAADLQMTADAYPAAQSAAFAVRTIRPALKWAAKRNHLSATLADLQSPAAVKARKRVLMREELSVLLPVLRDAARPHASLMHFLLLTLARLNEAAGARWRDINLSAATWTIPETKNGQPHCVPLSRQALSVLQKMKPDIEAPDALIFATPARQAGIAMICAGPGRRCSAKWARCPISSKPP